MENKKDRLLLESEVIAAVDRHTNNYNRLDDDITCILEDVNGIDNVEVTNKRRGDMCLSFGIPPEEAEKKSNRFSTIIKVINKYEDDNTCVIGEVLAYAIHKDLNGYDINILLEYLKTLEHASLELSSLVDDGLKNIYEKDK